MHKNALTHKVKIPFKKFLDPHQKHKLLFLSLWPHFPPNFIEISFRDILLTKRQSNRAKKITPMAEMGLIFFTKNTILEVNMRIIYLMMDVFCSVCYARVLAVELSGGKCAWDQ